MCDTVYGSRPKASGSDAVLRTAKASLGRDDARFSNLARHALIVVITSNPRQRAPLQLVHLAELLVLLHLPLDLRALHQALHLRVLHQALETGIVHDLPLHVGIAQHLLHHRILQKLLLARSRTRALLLRRHLGALSGLREDQQIIVRSRHESERDGTGRRACDERSSEQAEDEQ